MHEISALVWREPLRRLDPTLQTIQRPCALPQGTALLPLNDEVCGSLEARVTEEFHAEFLELTPQICALGQTLSLYGKVVYIETDYPGGPGPINSLLQELGVVRKASGDEFDSIGLGRWRDNQGWARQARI